MKIHGHPQKTDYLDDGSDWPVAPSYQLHWVAPGLTPMPMAGLPGICHTHVDVRFPLYAELNAPVVCTFTVKLFHTQGKFGGFYHSLVRDIIWDETGSAQVPSFVGDPMGLVVKTGRFTLDLAMPNDPYPNVLHGWAAPQLTGVTQYDNGDLSMDQASLPVYSMLDPSAPETPIGNGGGPVLRTMAEIQNTTIFAPNTTPVNYGETLAEYSYEIEEFIPIAPISAPWTLHGGTDGYGSADLPPGTMEVRLDPDFHNNVPGTVLFSQTGLSHQNAPVVIDPAVLAASTAPAGTPPGHHKIALIRRQTDGPEAIWALIVIDVAVAPTVTPTPVIVPNVMGQSQAAAAAALTAVGLVPFFAFASDPMVPAGDVSAQVPMMGVSSVTGTLVNLTISTGPSMMMNTVIVPNVLGQTQMAGSNALLALGLAPIVSQAPDPMVPAGAISAQAPMMGITVMVGSAVNLTVSTGPAVTPPAEVWKVMTTPPLFMQLFVNGVATDRFKICDPAEPMTDGSNCPEIVTK